jgi:hypothetical protein
MNSFSRLLVCSLAHLPNCSCPEVIEQEGPSLLSTGAARARRAARAAATSATCQGSRSLSGLARASGGSNVEIPDSRDCVAAAESAAGLRAVIHGALDSKGLSTGLTSIVVAGHHLILTRLSSTPYSLSDLVSTDFAASSGFEDSSRVF